ncbi:hypothetical protein VB776_24465 [Arcicella sp. DC2W]|uniref:DUF6984 domain-containing protein n=1 Tax=Arcicella gelida TaxID=2984195 RepID=A0ABU5SCD0_9BACT|nr:hypothetical protein [Arcicella sp. DC2W]MEA5406111.1 hypothetical protein [Arcicella sp. DC2W]
MNVRKATANEEMLLAYLISKASVTISEDWKINLLVASMDDGKMGSLSLYPEGIVSENHQFGGQISEYLFLDEDDVIVLASLYVDEKGRLFELDMWKTDYSPLSKLPF